MVTGPGHWSVGEDLAGPGLDGQLHGLDALAPAADLVGHGDQLLPVQHPRLHPRQHHALQGVISGKSVWELFIGPKKVCDKIWQKLQ